MDESLTRRNFLQSASVLGGAGFGPFVGAGAFGATDGPSTSGLLLNPDEGEVYLIGQRQGRVCIKVDKKNNGVETLSLLTEDIPTNDAVPVHKHAAEEELIYIERGRGIFTLGDEEHEVGPGCMALVPRGVWHGLRNEEDDLLRMVFGYSPAGCEDYFRAIGTKPGKPDKRLTAEDWKRINAEFGVTYRDIL